jgi:hypothetical protein
MYKHCEVSIRQINKPNKPLSVPIHVLSFLSTVKHPRTSWKYKKKLLEIQPGMINETVSHENYTEGITDTKFYKVHIKKTETVIQLGE